jgi:hypothetical protein
MPLVAGSVFSSLEELGGRGLIPYLKRRWALRSLGSARICRVAADAAIALTYGLRLKRCSLIGSALALASA